MLIRPYEAADRAALIALWHDCGLVIAGRNDPEADIDFCLRGTESALLVGAIDGAVVASVMVGHDGHRGWIYYVAVDRAHRRRGHGAAMVKAAEAWLAAHGAPKCQLLIRDTNAAVEAFYVRLGYETLPRIVMQKVL